MKEKSTAIVKIVTGVTFLVMIAINALANILPINGVGTGEVSDALPDLFAPAALTFSIWGVIYLLLALYTLYQGGVFNKGYDVKKNVMINKISILFIISSVANSIWIFAWHYMVIWLSLILMGVIFACLAIITIIIGKKELTPREKIFVKLPFSVYFGWITVATIANITAFLVDIGWGRFGLSEPFWAVVIIAVGAAIGFAATFKNRDFFYGLVLVWAYAGILIKHVSQAGFAKEYPGIIITIIISLAVLGVGEVLTFLPVKKKNKS